MYRFTHTLHKLENAFSLIHMHRSTQTIQVHTDNRHTQTECVACPPARVTAHTFVNATKLTRPTKLTTGRFTLKCKIKICNGTSLILFLVLIIWKLSHYLTLIQNSMFQIGHQKPYSFKTQQLRYCLTFFQIPTYKKKKKLKRQTNRLVIKGKDCTGEFNGTTFGI